MSQREMLLVITFLQNTAKYSSKKDFEEYMLHEIAFSIKERDLLVQKMKQFSILYDKRSATKIVAGEPLLEKSVKEVTSSK